MMCQKIGFILKILRSPPFQKGTVLIPHENITNIIIGLVGYFDHMSIHSKQIPNKKITFQKIYLQIL